MPRDAEATRASILDVALEEFSEKGLAGARVDEIAARTATSKHMIYYHFGSKDGLYSAVLARAYEQFRLAEGSVDYASLDPVEALRRLAGATFDVHADNPQIVRIIMGENMNRGIHMDSLDSFEPRKIALGTLSSILDRGIAQGVFRQDLEPLQIHLTISALSFHYIANRHTFGFVFEHDVEDPKNMESRRTEVIETLIARCLKIA